MSRQGKQEKRLMFNIGAVVLAGGASRRMGQDKAMLPWGESTFLEHILLQLRECSRQSGFFRETLICGGKEQYAGFNLPLVPDAFAGCGPLDGVYSALNRCRSSHLLALGCDMPFFDTALAEHLIRHLDKSVDAVIPRTRDGRAQPLCALYARSCAAPFLLRLREGRRRLSAALEDLRVRSVPLEGTPYGDHLLHNINTPEDYHVLIRASAQNTMTGYDHIPCLR